VHLSLRDRQGKNVDKDVVCVADRANNAIGRDPYF
jgi:hypothetical protein